MLGPRQSTDEVVVDKTDKTPTLREPPSEV